MRVELYYTPELSELHVGFKHEYSYEGEEPWIEVEATVDGIATAYDSFEHHEFAKEYRVKYLDRKDIESFDWKYEGIDKSFGCDEFSARISKYFNHDTVYSLRFMQGKILIKEKLEGGINDSFHTIFYGTCKNKSEFKKTLKQIGYEK